MKLLEDDCKAEQVLGWCVWGPLRFTEHMSKPWRLLGLVLCLPWFIVCAPVSVLLLFYVLSKEV